MAALISDWVLDRIQDISQSNTLMYLFVMMMMMDGRLAGKLAKWLKGTVSDFQLKLVV